LRLGGASITHAGSSFGGALEGEGGGPPSRPSLEPWDAAGTRPFAQNAKRTGHPTCDSSGTRKHGPPDQPSTSVPLTNSCRKSSKRPVCPRVSKNAKGQATRRASANIPQPRLASKKRTRTWGTRPPSRPSLEPWDAAGTRPFAQNAKRAGHPAFD
jgi:hypothetical protein